MDDFDVFTNEIKFSKSSFNYVLDEFDKGMPSTPNSANYQSMYKNISVYIFFCYS